MSRKSLLIITVLLIAVVLVAIFWREAPSQPEVADPVPTSIAIPVENQRPGPSASPAAGAKAEAKAEEAKQEAKLSDYEDVVIPKSLGNEEIDYTGFTVGFNPDMHQPNYVAWVLTPDHTDGPYSRKDVDFQVDPRVKGCATIADYKGSGFDRGHMAPAADMKWSKEAMTDCHYLTNMCPQSNKLNTGAWATVEKNTRKWAMKHGPVVIVAGPVLSDRLSRTIGPSRVPVPERFFKVLLAPEANPPMGLAFIMPNSYVEGGAESTVATIDQVEAITGFDFFSALPDDVENRVESESSIRKWNK